MSKGYLTDNEGNPSMMRAMNLTSLIAAIGVAAADMGGLAPGGNGLYFCGMFLVGAFAPKAVQKFAEKPAPWTAKK